MGEPEERSLEGKLREMENRLKGMTFVVAAAALVASIVSAYSAVQSAGAARESATTAAQALETARESKGVSDKMREIAQAQLDTAGAHIEVDPVVHFDGLCHRPDQPLRVFVRISNSGRIDGRIDGIALVREFTQSQSGFPMRSTWPYAVNGEPTTVPSQQSINVEMPINCEAFEAGGIDASKPLVPAGSKSLSEFVEGHPSELKLVVLFSLGGESKFDVVKFSHSYD
ncbi:hypothetical protein NLX62_03220 [Mycobacteriaceae bacterium Msp059]|nr:hypothetical protein [Mycobacteriaceae bacterium Msp059]